MSLGIYFSNVTDVYVPDVRTLCFFLFVCGV